MHEVDEASSLSNEHLSLDVKVVAGGNNAGHHNLQCTIRDSTAALVISEAIMAKTVIGLWRRSRADHITMFLQILNDICQL